MLKIDHLEDIVRFFVSSQGRGVCSLVELRTELVARALRS